MKMTEVRLGESEHHFEHTIKHVRTHIAYTPIWWFRARTGSNQSDINQFILYSESALSCSLTEVLEDM